MKFTIHNVGHGFCASLAHNNGNVMLWDCGHRDGNRPSEFLPALGIQRIDRFFVTNYDEDHVSDLPNLIQNLHISVLHHNSSISPNQLRWLKHQSGPISPAMESMMGLMNSTSGGPPLFPPAFPGVVFKLFFNFYETDFMDTNNISLVTFLELGSDKFIIPGDLEKPGWRKLLEDPSFRYELAGVTVFIASHHGRENGHCPEVFDVFRPNVVVFSDGPIKYATQEMASAYNDHARGVIFKGEIRRVLSTRKDDSFTWTFN